MRFPYSILFLSVALLGCSATRFHRYESTHIILISDGSTGNSQELLAHLERSASALEKYAFPYDPPLRRKAEVLLLSDERLMPGGWRQGEFVSFMPDYLDRPLVAVAGNHRPVENKIALTHELTHRYVFHHLPAAPVWLNEGLAMYYETLEFEGDRVLIGRNPLALKQRGIVRGIYTFDILAAEILGASELRAFDPEGFYGPTRSQNYDSAWSLVQALNEGDRRALFSKYLDLLQSGKHSEAGAWESTFVAVPEKLLLEAQKDVLSSHEYETELVSLRDASFEAEPRFEEGPVASEQEEELLARLALTQEVEEAEGPIDTLVQHYPKSAEARLLDGILWLRKQHPSEALIRFRKAIELDPGHPRYEAALLRLLVRSKGLKELPTIKALTQSLMKSARTAPELEITGRAFFLLHRPSMALQFAAKAIQVDPAYAESYQLMVDIEAEAERYASALEWLDLAENLDPHQRGGGELVKGIRAHFCSKLTENLPEPCRRVPVPRPVAK